MAPVTPSLEVFGPYLEALSVYLSNANGASLARARELGNAALAGGLEVSNLCAIHHESLQQIASPISSSVNDVGFLDPAVAESAIVSGNRTYGDAIRAAGAFLDEILTLYDKERRDLRRANVILRRQNTQLYAELRRVSALIYDDALQLVSAARLEVAASQKPATSRLGAVLGVLDQLEEHLSTCSSNLHLRVLEDLGLAAAIQSLTRRFSVAGQLNVTAETAIGAIPGEVSLAVYRVVLEALTNAQRHARAGCVRIRVYEERSAIHCSVRDDGIGFDLPPALQAAETHGSGFVSMAENVKDVGGALVIDSTPGLGTEVRLCIPAGSNL